MSHHCHSEGRCTMRPCYLLAAALGLLLLAATYLFGCPASPLAGKPEPIDTSAPATKEELRALRDEGLSLFGGLKADLERTVEIAADGLAASVLEHDGLRARIDEAVKASEKRSHELRVKLIGEARKELASAVAAESVIRGQQITGERSQRRNETGELFDRSNKTYDALLRHQGEITAIRKQLFAVEQAQLKHKCPEPCKCSHMPTVPAKVLPPGCPPNMYTIPYQGAYEKPRCR